MRSLIGIACLALATALPARVNFAQENPPADASMGDFFSGTVVSFTASRVVVNRQGVGKDTSVTRTFLIDASTRIEGALRAKAHVTVRFMPGEGDVHAVHIIVR